MVHSLELLLDDASDQEIRAQWRLLAEAGLPNQGSIRSGTNRPHVTLLAAQQIATSADGALTPVSTRLPVHMTIGAPIVFTHGSRMTLARLVVPSTELLSIHAQTVRSTVGHLGDEPAPMPHSTPGRWTPHVTVSRLLDPGQLTHALATIDTRSTIEGAFVAIRHWDGDATTETILAGRDC